jgi:hypothetical protein
MKQFEFPEAPSAPNPRKDRPQSGVQQARGPGGGFFGGFGSKSKNANAETKQRKQEK